LISKKASICVNGGKGHGVTLCIFVLGLPLEILILRKMAVLLQTTSAVLTLQRMFVIVSRHDVMSHVTAVYAYATCFVLLFMNICFFDRELSRFIAAGRLHCKIDKVGGIVETNRPDSKNWQYQVGFQL
jgi:hypothetical protein